MLFFNGGMIRLQRDPMTIMVAAGALYSGYSQNQASNEEAKLQRQQGDTQLAEAKVNANQEAWNQTQNVQKQETAFLANGVTLEGSPSAVVKNTAAQGQLQVQSILNTGYAQYTLAQKSAQITQNKGRAALISGVLQSGVAANKSYNAGYWGNQTPTQLSTGGDNFSGYGNTSAATEELLGTR